MLCDLREAGASDDVAHTVNYASIAKLVQRFCDRCHAFTLEALASGVAREVLLSPLAARLSAVTISVRKPEALKSKAVPSVTITRSRAWAESAGVRAGLPPGVLAVADAAQALSAAASAAALEDVYLALGSNLGRRASNIAAAVALLQRPAPGLPTEPPGQPPALALLATSHLYETPPAYVLHQPAFLNCVLRVRTNLAPAGLLAHAKAVEAEVGRTQTFRHGPRTIDVDVLLMGARSVRLGGDDPDADGALEVPHRRLHERSFVLGPLMDLAPDLEHPVLGFTVRVLLSRLPREPLVRVIPVRRLGDGGGAAASTGDYDAAATPNGTGEEEEEHLLRLGRRTFIMGVLNVTPDSFSDGGEHATVEAAVARARAMAAAGADIIDVGGQSTRPGADLLSAAEEAARVLPVLAALAAAALAGPASDPLRRVAVSVDTFYSSVARAAVAAGAGIVNDVSGGQLDPLMLGTAAELGVPLVLMHMRGTPGTMAQLASYGAEIAPGGPGGAPSAEAVQAAEEAGVVAAVCAGLQRRAAAAQAAGVLAWNVLVDPGLGFAKTPVHSLALLRQPPLRSGDWLSAYWAPRLPAGAASRIAEALPVPPAGRVTLSFPLLFGPSRKGFVAQACEARGGRAGGARPPAAGPARDWGTAAAVTASVFSGADFVRVHNPEAMHDVVAVADAVVRGFAPTPG